MHANQGLHRILFIEFIIGFISFYGNGIKPWHGERFQRISELGMDQAHPEINIVAGVGHH